MPKKAQQHYATHTATKQPPILDLTDKTEVSFQNPRNRLLYKIPMITSFAKKIYPRDLELLSDSRNVREGCVELGYTRYHLPQPDKLLVSTAPKSE